MVAKYEQGTYQAVITGQGFAESQFGWQFLLKIQPNNDGGEGERTVYLSLTDENGARAEYADKTMEVLRHLGFGGADADLAQLDPEGASHFSLVGVQCEAYCKHTSKDGKVFERWYINTPYSGGAEITTPANAVFTKLRSLFGKELRAPIEPAPPASEPANEPAPVPTVEDIQQEAAETKDSIPF
jgi:hypothetical protein